MRRVSIALVVAAMAPVAAHAQDAAPANVAGSFGGFRIEGNIGWDRTQSLGRGNNRLGYGGSAGWDGNLTDRIVVGPEVTYWRPNDNRNTNSVPGVNGGTVSHQGREMWSGDIRVGYRVTPDLLVFGKGGYVNQAQRSFFDAPAGQVGYATRGHADGYQFGGGVQFAPHDRFSFAPANMYVSAQYVYSQFDNHTRDQHAMAGVGFRFR
ncbi:outer membrane protein [Sphingomonas nostoxanthinifaciens]|uniref:outer membrane protein n=1 Tax=Sphingomonas nostoxanthinifaciens TaxID=2872652 RepID=UPI001CC1F246|nr:outer membrane beta-barrel protein [Sphingomonas nostoxanthinifaciens]UAK24747.1 porin family protein [Sphingomonas nostoxanthinifaciens]